MEYSIFLVNPAPYSKNRFCLIWTLKQLHIVPVTRFEDSRALQPYNQIGGFQGPILAMQIQLFWAGQVLRATNKWMIVTILTICGMVRIVTIIQPAVRTVLKLSLLVSLMFSLILSLMLPQILPQMFSLLKGVLKLYSKLSLNLTLMLLLMLCSLLCFIDGPVGVSC